MSTTAYTMLATSPRPQSPSTPTQATAMSDQQMDLVEILRSGEDSRLRRHRRERSSDTVALPAVVLFCGADQETEADWDEHRPWVIEMLPEMETPPARKRQKRSNGCGARVHAHAVPDRRWRGLLEGVSPDVVRLQDEYFTPDMKRELALGRERCGCSRNGVGCAVCGNAIGALFTPCARHSPSSPTTNFSSSHYTFLRAAVSPPLPLPTRPISLAADLEAFAGRSEREALARRIRDREELQQLRARMRAAQAPQSRPPPSRAGDAADDHRLEVSRLLLAANAGSQIHRGERERDWRAWEERVATVRTAATGGAADDGRAFEAWADATIQRATATASSDGPVVLDLSALMDMRVGASLPESPIVPRELELSEEERRQDWQREVVAATRASRSFGRDWPTVTRTIERTTAVPERPSSDEEVVGRPQETEEQEKEETTSSRTFFER
ncbi:hypothetical protein B0H17DRAFT_1046909 [Mycena rosella]|uniref:Uncharacterized protein n=1 Tax=Mycena rosella TaxID=1033263 RepID=A0AAD7DYH7_MYCRO|nr:hypothetical protein B0H17DRAFT_1046909 [Mycena rosella]